MATGSNRQLRSTPDPKVRRFSAYFRLRHPSQFVVMAFAVAILIGTLLLSVPWATEEGGAPPFMVAFFTATSAICVTGLVVVDTATYWSGFGEIVILILIQIGGFGIMALASLLALLVYRNLGVRGRILAQAETKTLDIGDMKRVLLAIATFSLIFEVITAIVLTIRFATSYSEPLGRAIYLGVFHAISAFNNAGFSILRDSLVDLVTDPLVILVVSGALIIGGIGFPVLLELRRELTQPKKWSLHTKMTLLGSAVLLVIGPAMVLFFEWSNPGTLGPLSTPHKFLAGFFQGVSPRTAGFHALDVGQMNETTWLGTIILMFIGGGSAGTAGGVKVATIMLVGSMVWAEMRGEPTLDIMRRRIPGPAQRQALSVVVVGSLAAIGAALVLMAMADLPSGPALFETFSAFGTVGLSTGITGELSDGPRLLLIALMFAGRVGPITLGAALAMKEHRRLYSYPMERPIVG